MNKGTAIVGFLLCFMAGMLLMWGIDRGSVGGGATATAVVENPTDWSDEGAAVPVSSKDPMWGSRTAPVTLVLYSDYECPFCSKVEATLEGLKAKYGPQQLRIIWKHNPLPFHKNARGAHLATETAFRLGGNDAFWKMHKVVFENNKGGLNADNYMKWAGEAGLDVAKFKASFEKEEFAAKIDQDMAGGKTVGVRGTPASFINGIFLSGAQPQPKFEQIIDEQLAAAKALGSSVPADKVYAKLSTENKAKAPPTPEADKAKEKPAADDKTVWKVPVGNSPHKGAADALVTIVEFSDFECPFCSKVEPTIDEILKTYDGKVRVVWKHRPLPFHKRATPASILTLEALAQKGLPGFWAAHALLFKNQRALSDEDLAKYAGELGLDVEKAKAAISGNKYIDVINADQELADDLEASGTPHFFVNGRRLVGAQPVEKFKAIIDEEIKNAEAMLAKGVKKSDLYAEIIKAGKEPPPPETKLIDAEAAGAPTKGAADAKVAVHIFSDYECPFCKRVEATLSQVEKEYEGKIKMVWRDKPLPMHKNAPLASEAAREALKQKGQAGFWAFHDELFKVQGTDKDAMARPGLEKIAEAQGLNMGAFKAALDGNVHKKAVDVDSAAADKAGISGTPAFVITYTKKDGQLEGYFINGAQPYTKFKKVLNLALAKAK